MGSGLSILPEFLTEEEVKRIARGKFNQATFDSLKTFDGLISREDFMNALQTAQENDIEVLFQKFCPNGQMESKTFVKMMVCKVYIVQYTQYELILSSQ